VLIFLRRHWFVMFLNSLFFVFMIILPFIIFWLTPQSLANYIVGTAWQGILIMFFGGYYMLMWLFFFAALVDYYLDVWVVTNERIIDIQQISLFKHVVAEQRIVRVQDVTSSVQGILPTFLNYGDVNIQTAGEMERFSFQQVPDPEGVKKIIFQAYEEAVASSGGEARMLDVENRRDGAGPMFERRFHE